MNFTRLRHSIETSTPAEPTPSRSVSFSGKPSPIPALLRREGEPGDTFAETLEAGL